MTTVLTVHKDGRWELDKGTLYDVTHLSFHSRVHSNVLEQSSALEQTFSSSQITCGLMRLRVWRAFDACEGL